MLKNSVNSSSNIVNYSDTIEQITNEDIIITGNSGNTKISQKEVWEF